MGSKGCGTSTILSLGTTISDASTAGNDGTVVQPLTTEAGQFHQAVAFGSGAGYIEVPDSDTLEFSGDFAISVWIRRSRSDIQTPILGNSGGNGESGYRLFLCSESGGGCTPAHPNRVAFRDDSVPDSLTLSTVPLNDTFDWHHIVVSRRAGVTPREPTKPPRRSALPTRPFASAAMTAATPSPGSSTSSSYSSAASLATRYCRCTVAVLPGSAIKCARVLSPTAAMLFLPGPAARTAISPRLTTPASPRRP